MIITGFKLYSDRNAIWCNTKEKAEALCEFLKTKGYANTQKGTEAWETYQEDTCYFLHGKQLGVISKTLIGVTNLIVKPIEDIMIIKEDTTNENQKNL